MKRPEPNTDMRVKRKKNWFQFCGYAIVPKMHCELNLFRWYIIKMFYGVGKNKPNFTMSYEIFQYTYFGSNVSLKN